MSESSDLDRRSYNGIAPTIEAPDVVVNTLQ